MLKKNEFCRFAIDNRKWNNSLFILSLLVILYFMRSFLLSLHWIAFTYNESKQTIAKTCFRSRKRLDNSVELNIIWITWDILFSFLNNAGGKIHETGHKSIIKFFKHLKILWIKKGKNMHIVTIKSFEWNMRFVLVYK